MIPYLALASVPIGARLFSEILDDKYRKKIIVLISFFAFLLFYCLRMPGVGVDFIAYNRMFHEIKNISWDGIINNYKNAEYGFWFLTKLISMFTSSEQVYMSVLSFLILAPIFWTYYKESPMITITLLLFLAFDIFPMSLSGARQSLAIAIIFFAFKYVKKGSFWNIVKFYLCVIIAYQFHISSIVAVFIYPLYHLPLKKDFLWIVLPFLILLFIFKTQIVTVIFSMLPEKYRTIYDAVGNTVAGGMMLFDIAILIMSFVFVRDEDRSTIGLRNMMIISVIFRLFSPINSLATRFGFYFIPFSAILIPAVLSKQSIEDKNIVMLLKVVVSIGAVALMINTLLNNDALSIYPYQFFWE